MTKRLNSGLFNTDSYNNPDRRYNSYDFVKTASFKSNGYVSGIGSELSVTQASGLTINVNDGIYNIEGHYIENSSQQTVTLTPTSAGNERYDIVVLGITRDSSRSIGGTTLSREGYVRVIEGTQASIDSAQIPFADIINEDFTVSSGTKEIEIAVIKVIGGSINEIIDKRVSTTAETVRTYLRTEIKADETIDLSQFRIESQATILSDGTVVSGTPSDIINKFIEIQIADTDLNLSAINITINGEVVSLELSTRYEKENYFGDGIYRFQIINENNKLYLFQESDNNAIDYFLQLGYKDNGDYYLTDSVNRNIKKMDGLTSGEYKLVSSYNVFGEDYGVNMLTDSPTKSFWIKRNEIGELQLFEVDINGNGSNTLIKTQNYKIAPSSVVVFWKGYIFIFSRGFIFEIGSDIKPNIQMISQNGDIIKTIDGLSKEKNTPFFIDGELFSLGDDGKIYSITINSDGTSFEQKEIETIDSISVAGIGGHGVSFKNGTTKVDADFFTGSFTRIIDGEQVRNHVIFKQRNYGRGY